MKTILFLLQKSQFSAVLGNKRCYLNGEESMSLSDSKPEGIVKSFEKNDDFTDWNDTKLFILYDSKSAKYLFKIIDGFEIKRITEECKDFSFQIKFEEKPIDLKGDISSLVKHVEQGDTAVLAEIDQLKKENSNLKNQIKEKDETIKKLESTNTEKDKTITKLNRQLEEQEKQKEMLSSNLDPYSKPNFQDKGDYIELVRPIGNIKKIQKSCVKRNFSNAEKYADELALDGHGGWRLPTEEELLEIYKIKDICGIEKVSGIFWDSTGGTLNFGKSPSKGITGGITGVFKVFDQNASNEYYVRCVK